MTLLKSNEVAEDGGEIWNLVLAEAPAKANAKPEAQIPAAPASDWQAPLGAS